MKYFLIMNVENYLALLLHSFALNNKQYMQYFYKLQVKLHCIIQFEFDISFKFDIPFEFDICLESVFNTKL